MSCTHIDQASLTIHLHGIISETHLSSFAQDFSSKIMLAPIHLHHGKTPFSSSAASRASKTAWLLPRVVVVMPMYSSVKCPEAGQQGESSLSSSSTHTHFDGGSQRLGDPGSLLTWVWWTRWPSGTSRELEGPSVPVHLLQRLIVCIGQ